MGTLLMGGCVNWKIFEKVLPHQCRRFTPNPSTNIWVTLHQTPPNHHKLHIPLPSGKTKGHSSLTLSQKLSSPFIELQRRKWDSNTVNQHGLTTRCRSNVWSPTATLHVHIKFTICWHLWKLCILSSYAWCRLYSTDKKMKIKTDSVEKSTIKLQSQSYSPGVSESSPGLLLHTLDTQ